MQRKEALDKILDEVSREKAKLLSFYLDEYSLGNGQFQILNEIAWEEGISQEVITRRRNIDKSATAKSIKKLIENDYVYKIRDEKDKRAFRLYCTEKGLQMIPVIKNIITCVDGILTKGSSEHEVEIFKIVCGRIKENISNFLESN